MIIGTDGLPHFVTLFLGNRLKSSIMQSVNVLINVPDPLYHSAEIPIFPARIIAWCAPFFLTLCCVISGRNLHHWKPASTCFVSHVVQCSVIQLRASCSQISRKSADSHRRYEDVMVMRTSVCVYHASAHSQDLS
ncbi:unnamed protein product [Somion occarium]|uniref:Uncharacterized protein n=1 Tax=Somion occarium TaxID=3059160 RepID=A0ABP1CWK8_9APHY